MFLRSILIGIITTAAFLPAQENETLNIYGSLGYGFGTGGQLFSSSTYSSASGQTQVTERKDYYLNYGQGLKIDLGLQYFLMESVALQTGFCISAGVPALETNFKRSNNTTSILDSTTTFHHNLFGLKVLAVPRFEILELMNVHAGVGIGFYWNSLKYEIVRTTTTTATEKGKIKSAPTLGLIGLIGGDYPLTDMISLFAEIGFEQMSFRWSKMKVESSQLRDIGSYNYEKDTPNQDAPLRISGSNWRISIGVRYAIL